MKQKMLLMTFFYNPAVVSPNTISESANPITEEVLFTSIEECVTQGGVVRVSHVEADLVRLACGQNECPPAHEWVGLTFVPVQPTASDQPDASNESDGQEVIIMEEVVNAY